MVGPGGTSRASARRHGLRHQKIFVRSRANSVCKSSRRTSFYQRRRRRLRSHVMKNLRQHKAVIATGVLAVFLFVCWSWWSNNLRGYVAARRDVRRGRYEILSYGMPTPWSPDYERCLRNKYNINVRRVAGCVISDPLVSYGSSYNAVVMGAAERKFGRDVFQGCAVEAHRSWTRRICRPYGTRSIDYVPRREGG